MPCSGSKRASRRSKPAAGDAVKRLLRCSLLALAALSLPAAAQYTLPRWTIDNGGGTSSGARFTLRGTIAQPDAVRLLGATRFQLSGGFWAEVQDARVFRDGFEE